MSAQDTQPRPAHQKDLLLSGGFGKSTNSARAGFLPICLERVPLGAFEGLAVHLRTITRKGDQSEEAFTLYCAEHVEFTDGHRQRLADHGVKFIYIPIAQQDRFRQQTEACLLKIADDPSVAVSVKSEIVYETSVELVNELLSEPDLASKSPRLEKVSRAVTTLVLNDPTSFSHLFAASHHDFYTATHMVNVATWMVPLAYAMGIHDVSELNTICQAGILHDIGKVYISPEVLNKRGRLSESDWAAIKSHPQLGCTHLEKYDHIPPLVHTVTRQHHERLDGSGYPDKLKGDQIHLLSKICAVVDSFDAMTAFRPFKERTLTVAQALDIIISEAPQKYDQKVVDAWIGLLRSAAATTDVGGDSEQNGRNNRRFPRFPINCPARAHPINLTGTQWQERPGIQVIAHNISRSGLGFLSQTAVSAGDQMRLYLQGKGSLEGTREGITVRCREYRDGWYEVGLQYAAAGAELSEKDFEQVKAAA
jgi:HD-GYP domain-containing protein (c-di-GMP phosphodiesterase class II)